MQIVSAGAEAAKWEKLASLAQQNSVPMPLPSDGHARAADRAQKTGQRKKQQDRLPKAHEVRLEPGFFVNEDNTPSTLLEQVTPAAAGLLLADHDEAVALCANLEGVQPDELAVLVLGHTCPDAQSCDGPLSFPAVSVATEAKVLLAGCLRNFGGRKIRSAHSTHAEVQLSDVTCCQFLVFADELDAPAWKTCTETPVRFVVEALRGCGLSNVFTTPWGRNFSSKGRPSLPANAECVSFQARVDSQALAELLRQSGQSSFYVNPRNWDKTPHNHYAVVWTGPHRADATTAAIKVPEQLGIVRSRSGFGIRVPEASYAKVYASLKPGISPPARVQVTKLFRLGPVPQRAGGKEVQARAALCSWQIRVIKALGPGHWLVGSAVDPPSVFPAFNGQTLLIQPVKSRSVGQAVVQSGSLPVSQAASASEQDPWLHNDPWKQYRSSRGLTAAPRQVSVAPAAREVMGPTEKRFQDQETRLNALEQTLQTVQSEQVAFRAEMGQTREKDMKHINAQLGGLGTSLDKVQHDLAQQLQTSVTSLVGAQAQQQAQMQANMDELKQLLVESSGFHKRAKTEDKAEGQPASSGLRPRASCM